MMELDFEDYIEEVKFQMIEYDILTEERILDWEKKIRELVAGNKEFRGSLVKKSEDDIVVKIKSEEILEETANKYWHAVKYNQTGDYFKRFRFDK